MSYLTDPQRLILRAALAEPEEAVAAFLEWQRHVELDDIDAAGFRLVPLIYKNIGKRIVDNGVAGRLKGISRFTWIKNRYRIEQCAKLLAKLADDNIQTVLLKGAAVMTGVTDDLATRQMGDCDILVSRADRAVALAALSDEGMRTVPYDWRTMTPPELESFHGLTFEYAGGITDVIDLHWRPLREVDSYEFTSDVMMRARRVDLAGQTTSVPCPEDMLLLCLVHSTENNPHARYDWLADATLILRQSAGFDWDLMLSSARKFGLTALVASTLDILDAECPGLVPADALRAAKQIPVRTIDRWEAAIRKKDPDRLSSVAKVVDIVQTVRRSEQENADLSIGAIMRKAWEHVTFPYPGERGTPSPRSESVWYPFGWHDQYAGWSHRFFATAAVRSNNGPIGDSIRLVLTPAVPRRAIGQKISIRSGLSRLAVLRWYQTSWSPAVIAVPLPEKLRWQTQLPLQFYIRRSWIPSRFEDSRDHRRLGMLLHDVRTHPARRDVSASPILLNSKNADMDVLWDGFSLPDGKGARTFGRHAELRWTQSRSLEKGSRIVLHIAGCSFGWRGQMTGAILLNGTPLGSFSFDKETQFPIDLVFPIPCELKSEADIKLAIELDIFAMRRLELGKRDNRRSLVIESVGLMASDDAPAKIKSRADELESQCVP